MFNENRVHTALHAAAAAAVAREGANEIDLYCTELHKETRWDVGAGTVVSCRSW